MRVSRQHIEGLMTTHSLSTIAAEQPIETHGRTRQNIWIPICLLTLYIVWGTTYLASHVAMESLPPYLLMGTRFVIAGAILLIALLLTGAPIPTLRQWLNSALVGGLILVGGTGSVALGQGVISSGLAATLVATVPLWTLLFNMYWKKPTRMEWIGVGLGITGVAVLTLEGNLQANPLGVLIILFAAASWSFGSVMSSHVDLPKGLMGNAAQMLMAGIIFFVFSTLRQEHMIHAPTQETLFALAYLVVFGAVAGMSAYMYLLSHVSPLLATSYTFVNPVIALFLGSLLAGEMLTGSVFLAVPLILLGVFFVGYRKMAGKAKSA
jgi:drug/metabolite transporter (DMT)-like permease